MTVNPGFGGQEFIRSTLKKVGRLREIIVSNGYRARIEVDGGIGASNLRNVLDAGAEIIVMGSAIFKSESEKNPSQAVREMKRIGRQYMKNLGPE
jgi:ribulose-phosphate 3-epimerase